MTQEQPVWSGSPSQWLNLGTYILCGLLSPLIVPIFFALWKYLELKNVRYELTTQRLKMHRGVLSKFIDDIELYRVKDTKLEQPFLLRLFNLGHVVMATSDAGHPTVLLRGLPDAENVREQLRMHVERIRDAKGVREIDFT